MHILMLGGIGEARQLAQQLASVHVVTYSVAGQGRVPQLPGKVRVGGFGGSAGLADFLRDQAIDLLIDATHPYAATISRNARLATQNTGIPLWAYRRPPWLAEPGDDWRMVADWPELMRVLAKFQRPFFTIGLEPLGHVQDIPPRQHWLVRCLAAAVPNSTPSPQLTVLNARGPFALEMELALLRDYRIDVLVSKNSGGAAVTAKLTAARRLRIPVIMLERPRLPAADREFDEIMRLSSTVSSAKLKR